MVHRKIALSSLTNTIFFLKDARHPFLGPVLSMIFIFMFWYPPHVLYQEQLAYSTPLWNPIPDDGHKKIGDVGVMTNGNFSHLLRATASPAQLHQLGDSVPARFEQLQLSGSVFRMNTRPPYPIHSTTMASYGVSGGASGESVFSVVSAESTHLPLKSRDVIDAKQFASTTGTIIDQAYLDNAFRSKEGFKELLKLTDDKAITAVNLIDKTLNSGLSDDLRRKQLAVLRKLCGNCLILPKTRMLAQELVKIGNIPRAGGAFADLWEGKYKEQKVAIKALRLHVVKDSLSAKKQFYKEAAIWCHVLHENILPFLGISAGPDFCLVSPWMVNGNLSEYVKRNPQANKLLLLKDVLEGLKYLHSQNIVHGDLKGANILINDNKRACLADFGLASFIADHIPGYHTSSPGGGTLRWMAPELLDPEKFQLEKCMPTVESDIFAIGMVICEMITTNPPWYPEVKQNQQILVKTIRGERPGRPDAATSKYVEPLWPIAEMCWREAATQRPKLTEVLECLEEEIRNSQTGDQTNKDAYVDRDNGMDTDEETC